MLSSGFAATPLVRPTHDGFLGTDIGPPSWTIAAFPPYASENLAFRHCCPFCWLFVYFPQALPTDNYENMRQTGLSTNTYSPNRATYGGCGCEG